LRLAPGVFEIHITVPISKKYKDMLVNPGNYTPGERERITKEYQHMCEAANRIHGE